MERAPDLDIRSRIREHIRVPASLLVPHPKNTRGENDPFQVSETTASLEGIGQVAELVTRRLPDGNYQLIDGHLRAGIAGERLVDVGVTDLDDNETDKTIIALNRLAELRNTEPNLLAALLKDVEASTGLEGTGYDEKALAALLAEVSDNGKEPLEDPGPQEPPKEPVTKPGDVWLMRSAKGMEHRLVCGDCCDEAAWSAVLGREKANLLLTDPPYNVGLEGYGEHFDDARKAEEYAAWTKDWFALAQALTERQIVTPGGDANEALWCRLFDPYHIAPWTKTNAMTNGKVSRFWCAEPIFWYGSSWKRTRANDVFDFPVGQQAEVGDHPCPKPLALWADLVENYSEPGDLVADCFCGSGTTVVACEHLGRQARCIELSPAFVDVAVLRWQKATGLRAILESTGQEFPLFEEVPSRA